MASAIALPLSALLPPSDTTKGREVAARALLGFDAPSTPLPKHTAILGPLPPSAPLSAADAFLALADIPAFEASEHTSTAISTYAALYALQPRPHALVLTGPREQLHLALEEQDPPFLRSHSYDLLDRLRRTDVRYAPSFGHLRLLIAVLGSEGAKVAPPSLVVLYDILGLLTMPGEREENKPPDVEETEADQPELARVLRPG
ncbi:hypothetical protein CC85DRAFT_71056 [Cutaneotrichosporon oleaginosum]|uniref:Uncharacterized protein n=1 Tax=Cutaneotrichosporon oleaginosum TaxID=879819 RepID=A0A0J0XPJ9_9TREE|nr:uncharacterized protein CC85DRAFT_71056 [Cutaneotrichosporon oleaginosum]KLT43041.1 hypothetical protein CC85DRAFT_71056 [Cutaneotrichosporon oleaginosum]TXT11758.1 hypothetical protein COLE_02168 [Cutaneotrichosporon oleaginosum]